VASAANTAAPAALKAAAHKGAARALRVRPSALSLSLGWAPQAARAVGGGALAPKSVRVRARGTCRSTRAEGCFRRVGAARPPHADRGSYPVGACVGADDAHEWGRESVHVPAHALVRLARAHAQKSAQPSPNASARELRVTLNAAHAP